MHGTIVFSPSAARLTVFSDLRPAEHAERQGESGRPSSCERLVELGRLPWRSVALANVEMCYAEDILLIGVLCEQVNALDWACKPLF
jgi:hypothetical protein